MRIKKSTARDAKTYFILANTFKKTAKNHEGVGFRKLEREYGQILKELNESTGEELNKKIKDKIRLKRYDSMNWIYGQQEFSNMGVWPKMKGLDILLTTGNVIETAERVKRVLDERSSLYAPKRLIKQIQSIKKISEFIYEKFPLILFPGGEIREKDYNTWARKNNQPLCSIFDFDIDDGCTRAVAYALKDIKQSPVYFGEYKNRIK